MRRAAVSKGIAPLPEHKMLLDYEKRGISRKYSYYALPDGCDTIFFPGCGLPGTRPKRTLQVYHHLRESIPNLGIVLEVAELLASQGNEVETTVFDGVTHGFDQVERAPLSLLEFDAEATAEAMRDHRGLPRPRREPLTRRSSTRAGRVRFLNSNDLFRAVNPSATLVDAPRGRPRGSCPP